jgi:hypothetical protein
MRIGTDGIARLGGGLYLSLMLLFVIITVSTILLVFVDESLPNESNTELLGVVVNAILTIGLLFLYFKSAKTQASQEDALSEQAEALSKQADTLSIQTDELTKQRDIMEKQQNLEQELHKLILDIDGFQPINDNDLQICVSNHGGGIARNVRIVSNLRLPDRDDEFVYESKLQKLTDKSYLSQGNTVAPEAREVEMKAEVKYLLPTESEETESCTFPELTRHLSSCGITNLSLKILLRAEDQHGNMDEDILYDVEGNIYSDMTLEEFLS